jgi:AcrR family transcriptional regulator
VRPLPVTTSTPEASGIRRRILDAVVSLAASTGMRKLAMDEVARHAGVGRATLYKYFPGRDTLVAAVVESELETLLAEVQTVAGRYTEPEQRLTHGFATAYRLLRTHPAVDAVLRLNPELLLPYVITEHSDALALGVRFVEASLPAGPASAITRARFAEHVARAFHTLILIPTSVLGLDEPEGPEIYARNFLLPVARHLGITTGAAGT